MVVDIDCSKILDDETFHQAFKETFGFPEYYGMNLNAWIDCMTYLDEPDTAMTKIHVSENQICTLNLLNTKVFYLECPDLFTKLNEIVAFVNFRRIDMGDKPILALSYFV